MLRITIPAIEGWDENKQEFVDMKPAQTLLLEHSLVSISKWESRWCKPFASAIDKTSEEMFDYIKCMTLTQNISDDVYNRLSIENVKQIIEYIHAPMTATWFNERKNVSRSSEQITSELIYYWMIALNIPFECQNWHLNRLLTLIRVCNAKNQPQKKMSRREILSQNAALNAARRKQFNSKG